MAFQAFSQEGQFSLLFKYSLIPQDWLVKIDQFRGLELLTLSELKHVA
jgi:hypothetical protein